MVALPPCPGLISGACFPLCRAGCGAGIANLAGATALRELNLAYSGVGDDALAQLAGLTSLRTLNLDSCHATDRRGAGSLSAPADLGCCKGCFLDARVAEPGVGVELFCT
jgi:hypothetical protein